MTGLDNGSEVDATSAERMQSSFEQAHQLVRLGDAIDGKVLYRIGGTASDAAAVTDLFMQDPTLKAAIDSGRMSIEPFNIGDRF